MPRPVAEVFKPLRSEVIQVHAKWQLFRQLFATDPGRIDLLNRFAPTLFGLLQEIMYDDVVLALFRLTEGAATCGKDNCTLPRLADAVAADCPTLGTSVAARQAAVRKLLDGHADWRNKRIGHNDLLTMQARWQGRSELEGPSRAQVEEIMALVRRLMNEVEAHYEDCETWYGTKEMPLTQNGDTLVRYLADLARRMEADRRGA
jgi:hypothetical protein